MNDLISRKAVIKLIRESADDFSKLVYGMVDPYDLAFKVGHLPSAEPEIIRCKDCKYRDENWRRVSVRWLPCMDVRTGSNWYCGSAERRTDDQRRSTKNN